MIAFVAPVLLASLAGGLHCLAMCGPFALAASGTGQTRAALLPYHLGRLVTYTALGGVAGTVGHGLDAGGSLAGFGGLSAVVAGLAMVGFGVGSLWPRSRVVRLGRGPARKNGRLSALLAFAARRPTRERAFLLGLSTTLIPCGWLYAFVASAAGTGAVLPALAVMFLFWLGTLPWLFGASFGLRTLVARFGQRVRAASAGMLAIAGVVLVVVRTGPSLAGASAPESGSAAAPVSADCPFHAR